MHFFKHSYLAKACNYLMLVLARQFLKKRRSNNSLIKVVYKICCSCLNFLIKQSVEFVNLNTQSGLIKSMMSFTHIHTILSSLILKGHDSLSLSFIYKFYMHIFSVLVFDKHFKNRFPAPVTYNVAFYHLNLT